MRRHTHAAKLTVKVKSRPQRKHDMTADKGWKACAACGQAKTRNPTGVCSKCASPPARQEAVASRVVCVQCGQVKTSHASGKCATCRLNRPSRPFAHQCEACGKGFHRQRTLAWLEDTRALCPHCAKIQRGAELKATLAPLFAKGLSMEGVGNTLGVTRTRVWQWFKEYPELIPLTDLRHQHDHVKRADQASALAALLPVEGGLRDASTKLGIPYHVAQRMAADDLILRSAMDAHRAAKRAERDKVFDAIIELASTSGMTIRGACVERGFHVPPKGIYEYARTRMTPAGDEAHLCVPTPRHRRTRQEVQDILAQVRITVLREHISIGAVSRRFNIAPHVIKNAFCDDKEFMDACASKFSAVP